MTDVASRLESLIRFRSDATQGDEPALARHLAALLQAVTPAPDTLVVEEIARASPARTGAYVFASWGRPSLLLNVHLDTVPPNAGWTADPFAPRREGDRIVGLGAADTKGATAAILAALDEVRPHNLAILFSGDEESAGRCMGAFLNSEHARGLERAIVCEPTSCRVGVRHRGVLALEIAIQGTGGHSSKADLMPAPLADAARLAVAYSDWGRARAQQGPPGFEGMCLNVAKLDGGIAFNVVPSQAVLSVSARCHPDADPAQVRAELEGIARERFPTATIRTPVDHPPFRTRDLPAFERWLGDLARAPIDLGYWTEAALLASAGIDAVVFGPGDIAQAHAPDEWVTLEQLELARRTFVAVLRENARPESNGTR